MFRVVSAAAAVLTCALSAFAFAQTSAAPPAPLTPITLPGDADYAAIKERLLTAASRVLENYAEELERQTRALNKTSWGNMDKVEAQVQLRFSSDSIEAIVRYPVPLARAAEVEERMSRALLEAARDSKSASAQLIGQPA